VWNGTAWVPAGNANAGSAQPASPSDGQLWYDTGASPDTLKVYNAGLTAWVAVNGSGGPDGVSATNTAVGYSALDSNTTGTNNTAFGQNTLTTNTTGIRNTAHGFEALKLNTTGVNNTATGASALATNTTGCYNTATGVNSLLGNTTGNNNTATGLNALSANTSGSGNTAVGVCSLLSNTTGILNIAVGSNALKCNTTGIANIATGGSALRENTTGSYNTAAGNGSLLNNLAGGRNTALGTSAMLANTSGSYNTAVGVGALGANTSGCGNVMVGGVTSAGNYSPVFNPTTENERVMIGSTLVTNAYVQVAWTVVSDARDKIVEGPVPHGLEFVKQLEPKAFHFKETRESEAPHGPLRYGFLAQDILALEGAAGVIIDNEDPDKLRYNGEALVPVLVNAVRELAAENEAMKARLDAGGL
jgi:hypothetical protein